jgi:hypothetical protein
MVTGDWLGPLRDANGRNVGNVAIAVGAVEPRPVVVAVHGAATRADWMCSAARASLGPRPFIICPHPVADLSAEASWGTPAQLGDAVERAFEALESSYGPWLDREELLYFGHSQGAMFAPAALARPGARHFRYVILFEGLPRDPSAALTDLRAAHVERLLLVSGQSGWKNGHAQLAAAARASGLAAKHAHADMGHFFNHETHTLIRSQLDWLFDDSKSWKD